ncbi:MAG: HIT family protein [Patescibacteria group bacterium]|jgi:diadenosine tetraphosphate (Ap4A) HIT family hydrolase
MAKYKATTNEGVCIFCDIASGRGDQDLVFWETDAFMAFLSIDPNTNGFSCVIPKKHFGSDVFSMPELTLQEFIVAAKDAANVLLHYFDDVGRVGMITEGTGIDHAHIKLVPMHGTEHLKHGEWRQFHSNKIFWFDQYEGWICSGGGPMANRGALRELAQQIKSVR